MTTLAELIADSGDPFAVAGLELLVDTFGEHAAERILLAPPAPEHHPPSVRVRLDALLAERGSYTSPTPAEDIARIIGARPMAVALEVHDGVRERRYIVDRPGAHGGSQQRLSRREGAR